MLKGWKKAKDYSWPIRMEFRALADTFGPLQLSELASNIVRLAPSLIRIVPNKDLYQYRKQAVNVYKRFLQDYDCTSTGENGIELGRLLCAFIKSLSSRTDDRDYVGPALKLFKVKEASKTNGWNTISDQIKLDLKARDDGLGPSQQLVDQEPVEETEWIQGQDLKRIRWFRQCDSGQSAGAKGYDILASKRPGSSDSASLWAKWLVKVLINDFWTLVPKPRRQKKDDPQPPLHVTFDSNHKVPRLFDVATIKLLFARPALRPCTIVKGSPTFVDFAMRYFTTTRRKNVWDRMFCHQAYRDALAMGVSSEHLCNELRAELSLLEVIPESDVGDKLYRTGKSDGLPDGKTWVRFRTNPDLGNF